MSNNTTEMNKRRVRDGDSDLNSDESKRVRVDSDESGCGLSDPLFSRVDSDGDSSESALETAEARLLQDDILNMLDSSESAVADRDPAFQGLDSVIRSFEEEITNVPAIQGRSDSDESQPELGYLLEASDDELGLPPTSGVAGEGGEIDAVDFADGSDGAVLEENHGAFYFEDEIPSYDSYEFGFGAESNGFGGDSGLDYVALGGLFDGYENAAVTWRTESLPAV